MNVKICSGFEIKNNTVKMKTNKNLKGLLLIAISVIVAISSCKKKKEDEMEVENTFNKSEMLSNIGNSIILPQYLTLKNKIDTLQLLCADFNSNTNATNLTLLRQHFINTYKAYQWASTFEFGQAEIDVFRANLNTFPCDTAQINSNIASGIYDLNTVSNIDAKGFPAIDFLLYRNNQNDSYIVSLFNSYANANAKTYLTDLITEMQNKTTTIYNAWKNDGGNYISTFQSNTGSDVGGSIGMLVNQLNFDFEILKNARIGIPLGKQTLGIPLPEKTEAYYSGISLELINEHIQSIENIYLGRSKQGNDGLGLDDYLTHINARYGAGSLNDAIKSKFNSAKTKLALIPPTLSQAVVSNPSIVDNAYAELQQLIVLLKVDMPSALGVLITYQDNDGD